MNISQYLSVSPNLHSPYIDEETETPSVLSLLPLIQAPYPWLTDSVQGKERQWLGWGEEAENLGRPHYQAQATC